MARTSLVRLLEDLGFLQSSACLQHLGFQAVQRLQALPAFQSPLDRLAHHAFLAVGRFRGIGWDKLKAGALEIVRRLVRRLDVPPGQVNSRRQYRNLTLSSQT